MLIESTVQDKNLKPNIMHHQTEEQCKKIPKKAIQYDVNPKNNERKRLKEYNVVPTQRTAQENT